MVVVDGRCANPKCTCSPCLCGDDCKCGGGTKLGDLELQVMEVVWAAGGGDVTARGVADALPVYAYTTVATVLNRLSRKGVVHRRLEGRTTHFTAVGTQADRAASAMLDALATSNNPGASLEKFVRTVSPAEAAELRRALRSRS